ncbi:MAG: AbiV family abortive infection protein [Nitrospira sp.]
MSGKRHIQLYCERLTPATAAAGIEAAMRNARSLLLDANLLFENHRWARAGALAILSIEESGKPAILRGILLARSEKDVRYEWKRYRNHCSKNLMWIFRDLVNRGAKSLEDLRPIFDKQSDHGAALEATKQTCWYSYAYGNCHWSLPEEVIDKKLAGTLVEIAEVLAAGEEGRAMTSEAELELWIKHMGPVWRGDMAEMKSALLACYAEADSLKILRGNVSPSEVARFVL